MPSIHDTEIITTLSEPETPPARSLWGAEEVIITEGPENLQNPSKLFEQIPYPRDMYDERYIPRLPKGIIKEYTLRLRENYERYSSMLGYKAEKLRDGDVERLPHSPIEFVDGFYEIENQIQSIEKPNISLDDGLEVIKKAYTFTVLSLSMDLGGGDWFLTGIAKLALNQLEYTLQKIDTEVTGEDRSKYLSALVSLTKKYPYSQMEHLSPVNAKITRHAVEIFPEKAAETIIEVLQFQNNLCKEYYDNKRPTDEERIDYVIQKEIGRRIDEIYSQLSLEYVLNMDKGYHFYPVEISNNSYEDNPYKNPNISLFFPGKLYYTVPNLFRYKDPNTNALVYCLENQLPENVERVDLFTDEETENFKKTAEQDLIYFDNQEEDFYLDERHLLFAEDPFFTTHIIFLEELSCLDFSNPEISRALGGALPKTLSVDSAGCLGRYVDIFNKIDSNYYLPALLGNIKSTDALTRRMSAEILYRLELGKVGVTEEGAKYLGKLYDLGKYNDPDFFVRRLNNSGLMAVLAEKEGKVEGVFSLDLYAEENVIKTEVRQLISQELFLPKADETPQQRQQREHYLQLFLENYESIFNDNFFEGTGVRLNSLDLHEQGWFLLNYLELSEQENTEDLMRLKSFVKQYGEYGLKSFLALEYGGSGKEILDFAEDNNLTREEKLAIFTNFYVIANEALNWRKIFYKAEEGVGCKFAPQVHEAFVRKNAEFFKAAQIIARGEGGDTTMRELLENMNTVAFSLRALKGIYEDGSNLHLEQKPQTQDEYDKDGNLIESASSSFILVNKNIGARVVVSVRPRPTVRQGNISGGESRINFRVTNLATKERARIGFDHSDYGESIGENDRPPVVSLDLGVGVTDIEAGVWPSQRVGRILKLVENSEGGHNELSFRPEVAANFPEIAKRFRGYIETKFVE